MEKYINKEFISNSELDTINIAYDFASKLSPKDIICFTGNLGAGKTRFIQGIARFFGVEKDISSPTFTIVNEYNIENSINNISKINHFDVYRLENSDDFYDSIGLEYFDEPKSISLIEWGNLIEDILPNNTIYIFIDHISENQRKITIKKGSN